MSDWNLYELEDISWDVFGDSCNHLVPLTPEQIHDAGGQLDSYKKARHDVSKETEENEKNIAENNKPTFTDGNPDSSEQQRSHVSKDVSSMAEHHNRAVSLPSTDVKIENTNINLPKNEQNDRSSCDLLDYEWPDFENFDVDNLFRNNYSNFGEGSSAATNELSWFQPNYDKADVSESSSKLKFKSTCSEVNPFKATSEHHGSSNMSWSEYGNVASGSYESSNFGYESYDQWIYPDARNKEDFGAKETINVSNEIDKATLTKHMSTSTVSYEESSRVTRNVSISSQSAEEKKLGQNLDFGSSYDDLSKTHEHDKEHDLVETSSQGTYICQIHGDPKNFLVPRPLNFIPPDHPPMDMHSNTFSKEQILTCSSPVGNSRKERKTSHLKKNFVQEPVSCDQSVQDYPSPSTSSQMTSGKKTEESCLGSHLLTKLSIGNKAKKNLNQNASSNHNSNQRTPRKLAKQAKGCSEREKASIASFRQLQDSMNQLDVRTKLCIRDGLYRLARNAEQRHVTDNMRRDDTVHSTPVFMDMETGTNPIDRSIAHLLFSRASEPPFSAADDTVSIESRIVNMKKTGAAANAETDGSGSCYFGLKLDG